MEPDESVCQPDWAKDPAFAETGNQRVAAHRLHFLNSDSRRCPEPEFSKDEWKWPCNVSVDIEIPDIKALLSLLDVRWTPGIDSSGEGIGWIVGYL